MLVTEIIFVTAFLVGHVAGTDVFVRPQGCPNDVMLIVDDSYRQLVNYTVDRCAAQCLADGTWCRSFSYYDNPTNSTKTCSLNVGHSDSLWTGLRQAQYWTYYERITEVTGVQNFGVANITTCQPNTYRDCRTALLSSGISTSRQVWLKLDNQSYAVPAYCLNGGDILFMRRSGIGFYDISWNRPWEEYKYGFGRDLNNFWMGLDFLYRVANQDGILRTQVSSLRCVFPRKLNGTTTRMTLSDSMPGRCPWWSIRSNGQLVISMRSLCICEDTVNANGIGHVALCGCNEPNRYQFVYSPLLSMVISRRPNTGNRCLRINADAAGEEIVAADCNQGDNFQYFSFYTGRYRNYWASWDNNNNFHEGNAVHTQVQDEPWNYQISAQLIYGCSNLNYKTNSNLKFATYDRDNDADNTYNVAMRYAGGDWWPTWGGAGNNDPRMTTQKDVSSYSQCGGMIMNGYMSLQADDYYY